MMRAAVPLVELKPGDQVIDLVAAGTVKSVDELRHSLRRAVATKITFLDDTMIVGRPDYTVVTLREEEDA